MKYDLADIASALEQEEALELHLTDHLDYYRYVLFQALPPSEQLDQLISHTGGKLRVGLFEPRVVGIRGPFLAVPLHTAIEPALQTFLDNLLGGMTSIGTLETDVTVPTPALPSTHRLGSCSACEDFIEDSRAIELRRLDALARQQEQEAERLKARLAATRPSSTTRGERPTRSTCSSTSGRSHRRRSECRLPDGYEHKGQRTCQTPCITTLTRSRSPANSQLRWEQEPATPRRTIHR